MAPIRVNIEMESFMTVIFLKNRFILLWCMERFPCFQLQDSSIFIIIHRIHKYTYSLIIAKPDMILAILKIRLKQRLKNLQQYDSISQGIL